MPLKPLKLLNTMLRSFRLKFFLLFTVIIVFFAAITRVSVRLNSNKPLHEVFYDNSATFVALQFEELPLLPTPAAKPSLDDPRQSQAAWVKTQLLQYFPNANAANIQVWHSGAPNAQQAQFIKLAEWRTLRTAEPGFQGRLAELQMEGERWVVFESQRPNETWYWAIDASVFQQQFETIMSSREKVVDSMWPLLVLYIFLCTLFLSSWVTRSLRHLQNQFSSIELGQKNQLLDEKKFDIEFVRFIQYFNQLILRLEKSYDQAARFSSDAAHELRTPLTVIRGNLKRLLNRSKDGSVEQMQLSMLSDEVERLISVTHKLLQLSQADGGGFQLDLQRIKLIDVLGVLQEDVMSLTAGIQFHLNVPPTVCIQADPNLFQQFINNLVSNAVKYTPTDGQINIQAEVTQSEVLLSVSNNTYLDVAQLDDRVFERFYRFIEAESAEKSVAKGDGLGLSLCKEIVKAHGGQLSLQTESDKRVTFVSTWPVAP